MLEDLVTAAVNQAITKGKQMHAETMKELTGGIPLPSSLQEALEKFTGSEQDENKDEVLLSLKLIMSLAGGQRPPDKG